MLGSPTDRPAVAVKVVRFHRGDAEGLLDAWRRVLGADGGPTRVGLATALDDPDLSAPDFGAVDVLWFDGIDVSVDVDSFDRDLDERLRGLDPALALDEGSVAVAVDEVIGRGADALAARWADGGPRFKMMSFGRRAGALTREGFEARWRAEAGTLGGERIPDEVRGVAYVQDHPVGDDPPLDAINEVWFDSLDDLRSRAAWLAARPAPADLMDPATCGTLCLVEELVSPAAPTPF